MDKAALEATATATAELHGLSECLEHLTPEWLQGLILHGGPVAAESWVAARVRKDPEGCLELLQVIMKQRHLAYT